MPERQGGVRTRGWGRDGTSGTNVGARGSDVSEAGGGRVGFVSAEGFGVKPWIVGEPSHIRCVVECFVSRKTE